MIPITSIRIVYRACEKWSENGGTRLGAALAYYALFSILLLRETPRPAYDSHHEHSHRLSCL
jgi:hypothetical protein